MQRNPEGIDETVQKTNIWINEVAEGLHTDNDRHAFLALRAVLHAMRDHLPVNESAHFSAQMPMLVRGAYYEGWEPSRVPVRERHADAFVQRVTNEYVTGEAIDPYRAIQAVGETLRQQMDGGELDQVMGAMPGDVRQLFAVAA